MEKKNMMNRSLCVLSLVVLAIVLSPVVSAITCQEVVTKLLPCRSYLVGSGAISSPCCQSAQSLNKMVTTKADRKAVCECIKKVGPIVGVNPGKAKQLPDLCHITLPVPIDLINIDCNKV